MLSHGFILPAAGGQRLCTGGGASGDGSARARGAGGAVAQLCVPALQHLPRPASGAGHTNCTTRMRDAWRCDVELLVRMGVARALSSVHVLKLQRA
jgi:hypothetical protein